MTDRLKKIGHTMTVNGVANTILSVAQGVAATVIMNKDDEKTPHDRMELCRACDFIRGANPENTARDRPWCGVCGCDLKAKTAIKEQRCPLGSEDYPEVAHLQQQW